MGRRKGEGSYPLPKNQTSPIAPTHTVKFATCKPVPDLSPCVSVHLDHGATSKPACPSSPAFIRRRRRRRCTEKTGRKTGARGTTRTGRHRVSDHTRGAVLPPHPSLARRLIVATTARRRRNTRRRRRRSRSRRTLLPRSPL